MSLANEYTEKNICRWKFNFRCQSEALVSLISLWKTLYLSKYVLLCILACSRTRTCSNRFWNVQKVKYVRGIPIQNRKNKKTRNPVSISLAENPLRKIENVGGLTLKSVTQQETVRSLQDLTIRNDIQYIATIMYLLT